MDLSTRIAPLYREKEIEIRNEIAKALERGKVDFSLWIDYHCLPGSGSDGIQPQTSESGLPRYGTDHQGHDICRFCNEERSSRNIAEERHLSGREEVGTGLYQNVGTGAEQTPADRRNRML